MTESVIADFAARFVVDSVTQDDPDRGRVLLSQKRLVMATGEATYEIPLSSVVDVSVGTVPENVSEFFDDTVTMGYTEDGDHRTAVVEGDAEIIERFSTLLFKVQLNGAPATVRHPVRVGGRVVETSSDDGSVRLGERTVEFAGLSDPFEIQVASVVGFEKERLTMNESKRLGLRVRHIDGTRSATTEITLPSHRKMTILGRYLRLEYSDRMAEIRDLDVTKSEVQLLIALYSSGAQLPDDRSVFARILGVDESRISTLFDGLDEKDLVDRTADDASLTTKGHQMIGNRIRSVDE